MALKDLRKRILAVFNFFTPFEEVHTAPEKSGRTRDFLLTINEPLTDDCIVFSAMKITEALFAEHLVFHNMFDHIEATAPQMKSLAEVKLVAALMESMLKAHANTEDELFIRLLEHCFEQIHQRDAFLKEHQEMDGNLERVQQSTRLDAARQLLLTAVAYSRQHFDKEERLVFPMAEQVLKPTTLQELGQAWMQQRVVSQL